MTSPLRDMLATDDDATCDLCGVECESLDAMHEWQDYAVCLACWEREADADDAGEHHEPMAVWHAEEWK